MRKWTSAFCSSFTRTWSQGTRTTRLHSTKQRPSGSIADLTSFALLLALGALLLGLCATDGHCAQAGLPSGAAGVTTAAIARVPSDNPNQTSGATVTEATSGPAGYLAAWGDNGSGQINVPAGNHYAAVAAGWYHNLALKSDGSLAAWGDTSDGRCDVPTGNDYTAVSAGWAHSLALRSNGSLMAWGNNGFGQCDAPAGNDYIAVAASWAHSLALKSDGSIVAWGNNDYGQLDVPSGNDFIAIATGSGSAHSVALRSDGSLTAWGWNGNGECNVPDGNNYVAISTGASHNLALKSDGSVVAWGSHAQGQCDVPAGNDYVAVSAGGYHSLALKSDGSIVAWGHNGVGQCDVPTGVHYAALGAGYMHSVGIATLPAPTVTSINPTTAVHSGSVAITYLAGTNFVSGATAKLRKSGQSDILATGVTVVNSMHITCVFDLTCKTPGVWDVVVSNPDGQSGRLANGFTITGGFYPTVTIDQHSGQADPAYDSPINFTVVFSEPVSDFSDGDVTLSGTAGATTAVVTGSGTTYNIAVSGMGSSGRVFAMIPAGAAHDGDGNANTASTSIDNEVTFREIGYLVAWGDNAYDQLGVPGGSNYVAVAAGWQHGVALRSDGSLTAWGDNNYGQCNVPSGTNFTAVSAGWSHSLALKSDGSLVAWGDNSYGQCNTPAGNGYIAICTGWSHSLALKSDGSLLAWGDNTYGQLDVPAGNNFIAISAGSGSAHSVALRSDGSLAAWGWNVNGECNIPAGNNYVAISTGGAHNVALRSDGSLVAWGWNSFGQCVVPAGNDYVAVSAGGYHSLALKSDGSLVAWGKSTEGQLAVPAGNNHLAVAGGWLYSVAIASSPPARANWWMFRHDPLHTGKSTHTGSSLPTKKWDFLTADCVDSSPAIGSDGTVYVGSMDGRLYAINPDGSEKWYVTTGSWVYSSPAIGPDGTIYVGSSDSKLYAINPDGSEKWQFTAGALILSSPAIGSDGTVYVGAYNGNLYAVKTDGSEKWRFAATGPLHSSPAIGMDGTVYVGSTDTKLYAVNPNGSEKWGFTTGGPIYSSPSIGPDGTVYVGCLDGKLYAVKPDGSQKWAFLTGGMIYDSSAAIGSDGTVYVGSLDCKLHAINPDGSPKWQFATSDAVYSSPAIDAEGTIYVGSWDGRLYAINSAGSEKWRFTTGFGIYSSPAIGADGTVYIGSDDYKLYAVGNCAPTVSSIAPDTAVNTGSVSITDLAGTNFVDGATVRLTMSGESDIWATGVAVESSTKITCSFDLTGKAAGAWDVVVTNTDGRSGTLPEGFTIAGDTTAPTVTINQAAGQSDPTGSSPINFTVVFSEPVSDFATGDVTIGGTSGGTKTGTVTGSGTTYNVAVSGMTTAGTIVASIGPGVAHDAAGNGSTASTSTDNSVSYNTPPQNFSVAPGSGVMPVGATTTLTAAYSDSNGNADFRACYLLVNDVLGHANGVSLYYNALVNKVFLKDDAGTTLSTGYTPGTDIVLSNSQCEVFVKNTVVTRSGDNLSIAWSVKLKTAMSGKLLSAWLSVYDVANTGDSWEKLGTYINNVVPQNYSIVPSAGTLLMERTYALSARYRDLNGNSDIKGCYAILNSVLSHANSVSLYYNALTNRLYLKDDANTTYGTGYAPGTDVVLSNSQCEVYVKDTTITYPSSTDMCVVWSIKLKPIMASKPLFSYMSVYDKSNAYDGWEQMGTYNSNVKPVVLGVDPGIGVLPIGNQTVLTGVYRDENGYGNLKSCHMIVNTSLNHVNAASLYYDAKVNKVYLRNDANTAWSAGHAPGTDVVLSNSHCDLNVRDVVVNRFAVTDMAISWPLTLKPSWANKTLNAYLLVYDNANGVDGWKKLGTYTTP